jgi:hypothetical protein
MLWHGDVDYCLFAMTVELNDANCMLILGFSIDRGAPVPDLIPLLGSQPGGQDILFWSPALLYLFMSS